MIKLHPAGVLQAAVHWLLLAACVARVPPSGADPRADASGAASFPRVAPDSTPSWFQDDSSYACDRTLKRVAVVTFYRDTAVEMKRAALKSVAGKIVGGYHLYGDPEGRYFVLLARSDSDSLLVTALQTLQRSEGVKFAWPYAELVAAEDPRHC